MATLTLGMPCDPAIPLRGNHPRESLIKIPERPWAGMFMAPWLVAKRSRSVLGKLEQQQETNEMHMQQRGQVDLNMVNRARLRL